MKKLNLKKEVIVQLKSENMRNIEGGTGSYWYCNTEMLDCFTQSFCNGPGCPWPPEADTLIDASCEDICHTEPPVDPL